MARQTWFIVRCDIYGCPEEVTSIRSFSNARRMAKNYGWSVNRHRPGFQELCPEHKERKNEWE